MVNWWVKNYTNNSKNLYNILIYFLIVTFAFEWLVNYSRLMLDLHRYLNTILSYYSLTCSWFNSQITSNRSLGYIITIYLPRCHAQLCCTICYKIKEESNMRSNDTLIGITLTPFDFEIIYAIIITLLSLLIHLPISILTLTRNRCINWYKDMLMLMLLFRCGICSYRLLVELNWLKDGKLGRNIN